MTNVLKHNGYQARVDFDAEDRIFVGRIVGIDDIVTFHADTVDELVEAFKESLDDYIETCSKIGKNPDRSYSGTVYLRVSEATHANAAKAAELAGKSLNEFGEEALQMAAFNYLSHFRTRSPRFGEGLTGIEEHPAWLEDRDLTFAR
jgi:predicted HicB family RNase H-like nuclease